MEKLKKDIRQTAEKGIDFGCKCYYCESTLKDLLDRGDAIPIIYEMGNKNICFRCSEGGYYISTDHVKNIAKKIELIKAYSGSGFDSSYREKELKKLENCQIIIHNESLR